MLATVNDFLNLDIRVGTIVEAETFDHAVKPAYKIKVYLGEEIGIKKSSAQLTQSYKVEELIGKQVLAIVNFTPKQISDYLSEVLVLGTYSEQGIVLVTPDMPVKNGDKLG